MKLGQVSTNRQALGLVAADGVHSGHWVERGPIKNSVTQQLGKARPGFQVKVNEKRKGEAPGKGSTTKIRSTLKLNPENAVEPSSWS